MNKIPRYKYGLSIFIIVLLGLICYSNTLYNGFVWDDNLLVLDNLYIKDFSHILDIFTKNLYQGTKEGQVNFYRPLQNILLLFSYQFWKANSFGYHLVNVLLHIANAILIYVLILNLFKKQTVSLLASLFFVSHPIHTQAVAYISGAADLLATFFILMSFYFFIRFINNSKPKSNYIISLILFTLAILSKEFSVIYPFILLCYVFIFVDTNKKKETLKNTYLFFVSILAYFILRYFLGLNKIDIQIEGIGFYSRALTFLIVFVKYIKLFILPFPLYPERILVYANSIRDPYVLMSLAAFLSFLFLIRRTYNKSKEIFFGLAWFLIAIIPVSNAFVPINAQMAEHWLYFPSIGLFISVSLILNSFFVIPNKQKRFILYFLIFTVILFYSSLTARQNQIWRDEKTLYNHILKYSPKSARIHYNLANVYRGEKQIDKAIIAYNKSLDLKPNYVGAHNNLGNLYDEIGEHDKAVEKFKKSLNIRPNYVAYNSLGIAYCNKGLCHLAIEQYNKAIELNPDSANAYTNLGNAYFKLGKIEEAKKAWKKALRLDPALKYLEENITAINKVKK